jgi:hypothetical protein
MNQILISVFHLFIYIYIYIYIALGDHVDANFPKIYYVYASYKIML